MNVDKEEILNFEAHAHEWWNVKGPYKILHKLNPLRLNIGCGWGLLSEELAKEGGIVTSIDASEKTISVAKNHAKESKLNIDYQCTTLEEYTKKVKKKFDFIICFELIEHVPNPKELLTNINSASKKNSKIFLSTINRNIQSFFLAKIMAEYILKIIPKGTHKYEKFIKPSELTEILEDLDYDVKEIIGMILNPLTFNFELSSFTNVNYFL